jgi:nucleotidyltransferase substrate binding protein (TIGR01987 family)
MNNVLVTIEKTMTYTSTTHLQRALQTLQASLIALQGVDAASIEFEIYRNAVIRGFELTLEVCCKLLRKALKAYEGSPKEVDSLTYKDVFRRAATHGLLSVELVERWFRYRENRNNTAHDYGVAFADATFALLPQFIQDTQVIIEQLNNTFSTND